MFKGKTTYSYKNKFKKVTYSLKEKIIFTSLILILIQFLSQIPIYGINRELIDTWLTSDLSQALGIFTMFSGSSFANLSIFALGIAPYITSSIIIQLLRVAIPSLDEICKDGATGKDKAEKFTYIGAGIIGAIQIIPMVFNFASSGLLIENSALYIGIVSISLFLGSALLIFLGKTMDNRGIGNGISLILLVNILSTMPGDFYNIYAMFIKGKSPFIAIIAILVTLIIIVGTLIGVIYLNEGKKEIRTTNSGKMAGRKTMKGSGSSIPLKVNMSGVMPVIFASSLMQMFPVCVALFKVEETSILYKISNFFNQGNWFDFEHFYYTLGLIPYVFLVIFFAYFYNMISFNTKEISRNLASNGTIINGIRQGKPTEEFLNAQLKYLLLLGSLMLVVITLIPTIVSGVCGLYLSFGGTSLLIVVSVIVETYGKVKVEKMSNATRTKSFINK